ncbi:hypothetical protein BY996DRAFT_4577970 [Phakopsora pachyrhizi]|nr:hypothetical protein BY996DRAFT_4577970 [Phakopsora pachyrhizi]
MSFGERGMISLGRAILIDSNIAILDEDIACELRHTKSLCWIKIVNFCYLIKIKYYNDDYLEICVELILPYFLTEDYKIDKRLLKTIQNRLRWKTVLFIEHILKAVISYD